MRNDVTDDQVRKLGREHALLARPLSMVEFFDHFGLDVKDVIGGGYPAKAAYAQDLQAWTHKRIMPDGAS